MKLVPDTMHGLGVRPHYEPGELDREFERITSQFIKRRKGSVSYPLSTDDLTVLIEEHVEQLDIYADLSALGASVEGVTAFTPGRRPKVLVSQHLGAAEGRENRLRTTLAHEFGHVHLHSYIIDLAVEDGLIDRVKGAKITCKRETMLSAPLRDWREWQAGYACGAILMPARALKQHVADRRSAGKSPSLISDTAQTFQVSEEAARVRLNILQLI